MDLRKVPPAQNFEDRRTWGKTDYLLNGAKTFGYMLERGAKETNAQFENVLKRFFGRTPSWEQPYTDIWSGKTAPVVMDRAPTDFYSDEYLLKNYYNNARGAGIEHKKALDIAKDNLKFWRTKK